MPDFTKYINLVSVRLVENMLPNDEKISLDNHDKASCIAKDFLSEFDRECMIALLVDTKLNLIGVNIIAIGYLNGVPLHPREVFKGAILANANSIILAHNHTSGNTTPSIEDESATKIMVESGSLLGIPVLDHIIVGDTNFSFKNNGLIS